MKQRQKVNFISNRRNIVGLLEYPTTVSNKAVIFSHGLTNSKEQSAILSEIKETVLNNGFITFSFDYCGSGESDGLFKEKTFSKMHQNLNDAIDFLQSRDKNIKNIFLCGKSVGGNLIGLCGKDKRINGYIFIIIPVKLNDFFGKYFTGQEEVNMSRGKAQPSGTLKGDFVLQKDFFTELPDIDKTFAKNVKNIARALVIINKGDEKVTRENSTPLHEMLHGQKELIDVETHSHDLHGHEKQIIGKVIHWLNQ
jgi:uncharacterized protein